jgi:DNA-binding response OmpR family regulator
VSAVTTAPSERIRLLSIDDELDTIRGNLDSLSLAGHEVLCEASVDAARRRLTSEDVDLLILDQRLDDDDDGGTTIVIELKEGRLGKRNMNVPFVFVTGSSAWVDRRVVSDLPGFTDVLVKGGDLTRVLLKVIASISPPARPPQGAHEEMRRVPLFVESRDGQHVVARVPPWEPDVPIRIPEATLLRDLHRDIDSLVGSWLMVQMNLYEPDADCLVFHSFEETQTLSDDDGLA